MSATVSFYQFVADLAKGVHKLDTDTLKVALTNTAPSRSNTIFSDITEIAAGNGYTAGGQTLSIDTVAQSTGSLTVSANSDITFTATGVSMAPFRYAVIYNDTPVVPLDPLIGYIDTGSSRTLAIGESHTLNFNGVNLLSGAINSAS